MSERLPAAGASAPTILLVDDSADNRLLLLTFLAADGCRVLEAEDGEEALRIAAVERPDLILLDVLLPGLSGFEVCARLRADPALRGIPVIMVTSLGDAKSRARAFEADADEFLSKPVNREELIARVRSMLRLRRAQSQLEAAHRHRLQSLLERYVSKPVATRLLELPDAEREALLNHRKRQDCTVMFTDIRGFTAMSDALDPDSVVDILNSHLQSLTEIAYRHSGTVLNMTGDGLLIGFGVLIPHADPAGAAVAAALEMHQEFAALQAQVRARHALEIGLGVGIHSGPAIVGNVGSEQFLTFTAVGDTVNVAARIQHLAEPGSLVVSAPVWDGARRLLEHCHWEALAEQRLRGKSGDQLLYRIRAA